MGVDPQDLPDGGTGLLTGEPAAPPQQRGRRVHPFFRDVGITVLAQVGVAVGGLLLSRLLAIKTGREGFASYSLVKQSVSFLFPIVTVGLMGGLPRYLALPREERGPSSAAYLSAAMLIAGGAAALAAGLVLALQRPAAAVFFGDADRSELIGPFAALLAATTLFYIAYGYFRGLLRIRSAGALQLGAFALPPPLIVLAFPHKPIDELILLMAIALAVLSLLALLAPLARSLAAENRSRAGPAAGRLWNYGHRRVPGELAQLGLFVLVPVLAAHAGSLTDVAYLSAGQQILSVLSLAVLPLGLVLLPSLTRLWAESRERASRYVGRLSSLACHVALLVSFQAVIYGDVAVRIWLGSQFDDAGAVVRIMVAPAALYVVYLMLRSSLDAVAVKSYNSRNNIIALAVFGAVAGLLLGLDLARPAISIACAFAAGVTTQGLLTFATVHRLFGLGWDEYALKLAVPLALGAAAIGLGARPGIDGSSAALPLLAGLELVLATAYIGALFRGRVGWTRLLVERFFDRGA